MTTLTIYGFHCFHTSSGISMKAPEELVRQFSNLGWTLKAAALISNVLWGRPWSLVETSENPNFITFGQQDF